MGNKSFIILLIVFACPVAAMAAFSGLINHSASRPAAPSRLDTLVQQAAAAYFRNDTQALQTLAGQADQLSSATDPSPGRLALTLRELAATLEPSYSSRLEQARALDSSPAAAGQVTLLDRIKQEDPLLRSARIEQQKRWNRAVAPFNSLSRNVLSFFEGNTQVLLSWLGDALERMHTPSQRNDFDRKLQSLYTQALEQPLDPSEAARARQRLEELNQKEKRITAQELLTLSELHLQAGHPYEALYYSKRGLESGADAAQARLQASEAISTAYRNTLKSFESTAKQSAEDPKERENLTRMLTEANRGPSSVIEQAAWENARGKQRAETSRYVLFGELPARDQLDQAYSGAGLHPPNAFRRAIAVLFFPDAIVRGVKAAFGAGASKDPLRDAAAQYLHADPHGERAPQLSSYLARQAEQSGHYTEARMAYARAGVDDAQKRQALRNKEARDLYAQIQQVPDPVKRQTLLQQSARQFAGTKYEAKARESAVALQKRTQITLKHSQLAGMPSLWRDLNWPAQWLDGNLDNTELDSVSFIAPDFHEAIVNVSTNAGTIGQHRMTIQSPVLERLQATLSDLKTTDNRLESADVLSAKTYVPLDFQGGIGGGGLSVYPSLQKYSLPQEEQRLYR